MARDGDDYRFHLDPLSDAPGSHPVGTGLGAAAGGAAAAAVAGAMAGPVGLVAGAVAGAVLGGLGGKAAAEAVNPTAEEAFWRERYTREPYYEAGRTYEDYGPAYELGFMGWMTSDGAFEVIEARLANEWQLRRDHSGLSWVQARPAARAAWERVEQARQAEPREGDPPLVDALNRLLAACHDGAWGMADGAEHAQGMDIARFLQRTAQDWRLCALELRSQVQRLGGTPEEGGTPGGALHRGWLTLRAALPGYNDPELLAECERTQQELMKHVVDLLQRRHLPEDVRTALREVEQRAQRRLGQIRTVRESFSPT